MALLNTELFLNRIQVVSYSSLLCIADSDVLHGVFVPVGTHYVAG